MIINLTASRKGTFVIQGLTMALARRYLRSFLISSLLALLISGCGSIMTVGPDYEGPPAIVIPSNWNTQTHDIGLESQDFVPWWNSLNDPVLNQLLDSAYLQSLGIKIATFRIQESLLNVGITRSLHYPSINAFGSVIREKTSQNLSGGLPFNIEDYHNVGGLFGWELDIFGKVSRQIEASTASAEAEHENFQSLLVILHSQIVSAYFRVRTLQRRLEIVNKNVAAQRETLKIVEGLFNADLTSELDINQATQNLSGTESTIPLIKRELQQTKNKLALLLAQTPNSLDLLLNEKRSLPIVNNDFIIGIPRETIRQRPDVRKAERQLAAQTALVGVAEAELYPSLSLQGVFGFSTLGGSLISGNSQFWEFGTNFSWNVFSASRNRRQLEKEKVRVEIARLSYENTVLKALEDVEAALINFDSETIRISKLTTSVNAAKNTVQIAKSQYRNGLTSFQTVLDAERVLFLEEDRLIQSFGARLQHAVNIYRALGGGWSEKRKETVIKR